MTTPSTSIRAGLALALCTASGGLPAQAEVGLSNPPTPAQIATYAPAWEAGPCRFCWAFVDDNGTVLGSRDVIGVIWIGKGKYDVRFRYRTIPCTYQATVGKSDFGPGYILGGEITVLGRVGSTNAVVVSTYDSSGAPRDTPFNVLVFC